MSLFLASLQIFSFIEERLSRLRERHNVVLVTNDHLETLTRMADNVVQISAAQRHLVQLYHSYQDLQKANSLNQTELSSSVVLERKDILKALSVGFAYSSSAASTSWMSLSSDRSFWNSDDAKFFFKVELWQNKYLRSMGLLSGLFVAFFLAAFWDSDPSQRALVLVAGDLLTFFCVNPYLLTLVDWRNAIEEESHAFLHTSKALNRFWKTTVVLALMIAASTAEFVVANQVVSGLSSPRIWLAMLLDSWTLRLPSLYLGIYSRMDFDSVQSIKAIPTVLMTLFSATYRPPGAGVSGVSELRYFFSRFYFWCMVPGVQDQMEGCPGGENNDWLLLLCMCVTSFPGLLCMLFVQNLGRMIR